MGTPRANDEKMAELKKLGTGANELKIEVNCCNLKKLDLKFYGIEKPRCKVVLKYKDHEYTSEELAGLDPTWEEEFIFCVDDVENDNISAVFYICDQKGGDEPLRVEQALAKEADVQGPRRPGGKADFMFT